MAKRAAKVKLVDRGATNHQLTGVAGVHYVAAFLSYCGLHAVPTTRNVRGPDLLLSNMDGSEGLSLQVKMTLPPS